MLLRYIPLTSLCILLAAALQAPAITDAWSVDVRGHAAVQRTYKRGETVSLHISLRDGLAPLDLEGATAVFYWYTNAVQNLWWTNAVAIAESTLSLEWTPAMDVGAESYPYWIGIWPAGATTPLWRVNGTVRLLGSPGVHPNALELPVRVLDFATVAVTNAPWAATDITVATAGGYASPDFWWPCFYEMPAASVNGATQTVGDVTILVAENDYIMDRKLAACVDERPLNHALSVPSVGWSVVSGDVATLDGDVLLAVGIPGMMVVNGDAGDRGTKRVSVPFAAARGGQVLLNPLGEVAGTWREAVATNVLHHFAIANTNVVSPYRFCRNSSHGPQTTNYFPDAYQLYGSDGVNDDAVRPTIANSSFCWPELADALRCTTAWRGDWYADAPYVIVAPHYAVGANHFTKSYTQTYWCFDRESNDFRLVPWDTTAPKNGKIGTVRDISIHRFETAMPSNMIARVVRGSLLKTVSASVLDRTPVIGHTCHNTVALFGISAATWEPVIPRLNRSWNESFGASESRYPWVADIGQPTPQGAIHRTHLWDSGHPLFWWVHGHLVLAGTWTTALGGSNVFAADTVLDQLDAAIRHDSGGTEGLYFLSEGDLQ